MAQAYRCDQCTALTCLWRESCPNCLTELSLLPDTTSAAHATANRAAQFEPLVDAVPRIDTGLPFLQRAFGGGLPEGRAIVLVGDPNAGKSTLLLQLASGITVPTLYATSEQKLFAVRDRLAGLRLAVQPSTRMLATTDTAEVFDTARALGSRVLLLDSWHRVFSPEVNGRRGSPAQLRHVLSQVGRWIDATNGVAVLVAHVRGDGTFRGPRDLVHDVDAVFYLSLKANERRYLETVKTRIGPELRLRLEMTPHGLVEVPPVVETVEPEGLDAPQSKGRLRLVRKPRQGPA